MIAAKAVFGGIKTNKIKSAIENEDLGFQYIKEIMAENSALLEFETIVNGTYINVVDLISWDETEKITEFKVMVRPLQAVKMLQGMMQAMLEQTK